MELLLPFTLLFFATALGWLLGRRSQSRSGVSGKGRDDAYYHSLRFLLSEQPGTAVDEFIQAIGLYPAGSVVQLSDGSTGVVLSHNKEKRLKPEVLLIKGSNDQLLEKPKFIDLSKKAMFSNKERPCITGAMKVDELSINVEEIISSFNNRNIVKKLLTA